MDRITAAEVFVAIVERGSMSAAASLLDMSRATVSRYLNEMETWAQARLLHCPTRKLSLTDAGEKTLQRCREMLALVGDMRVENASDVASIGGLLRVSCSQSLGQTALGVAVDMQMNNRAINLVEDRIDLVLRITNALDPNLIACPLGQCASVLCAAPAYLAKQGMPRQLSDLSLHNCLTYTYFSKSLWNFTHDNEPVTVSVSGNLSGNESLVLLSSVLEGAGITLQPRYSVQRYLASGALVRS